MKRFLQTVFVLTLTVACLSLPAAETLDSVLAKYYKAYGGLDKINAMKSVIGRGKTFIAQMGMEVPMTIHQKRPNLICIDIQIQDKTIRMAYDGKTPWQLMPFMSEEPQVMTGDQAKEFVEGADFDDVLVVYKKAGHKVELIGAEDLEGTPVHHLKVVKANGREVHFYIDQESSLLLKAATTIKVGESEILDETYTSDYKEVNGVMLAFSMDKKQNGQPNMKITMESYELNTDIDDSLFVMPVKATAPVAEKK